LARERRHRAGMPRRRRQLPPAQGPLDEGAEGGNPRHLARAPPGPARGPMIKYDLAKMLEEIRLDERGGKPGGEEQKRILTQEEIREMAKSRRRKPAADKAGS